MINYEIQGLLVQLKKELNSIDYKFAQQDSMFLDINQLIKILNYVYTQFSQREFYLHLVQNGYNLYALSDYDFIVSLIQIYQKILGENKVLTADQFFDNKFIKLKLIFVIQSIRGIKNWLKQYLKNNQVDKQKTPSINQQQNKVEIEKLQQKQIDNEQEKQNKPEMVSNSNKNSVEPNNQNLTTQNLILQQQVNNLEQKLKQLQQEFSIYKQNTDARIFLMERKINK